MIKIHLILALVSLVACSKSSNSNKENLNTFPTTEILAEVDSSKTHINLEKSTIKWFATEMGGLKKRSGKVQFKSGYFLMKNGKINNGSFIVAMNTLDVTDMPPHETTARRNVVTHLKNEDFFDVKKYPEATLKFTNIVYKSANTLEIEGMLTIKGISKNIRFTASQKVNGLEAQLEFDRFDYNIAYQGSWVAKTFIDRKVSLNVKIYL